MALDVSVKHYTNAMNAIPSLTSAANSLIQLLDAVLVNGFGNVTLTSLTVSNNIATATVSTGYVTVPYSVVTISGATPNELNGDKKVLSGFQTNSFTFDATGVANGAATGTITCRFPGAGWTKPYANTAANVAVYMNSSGFHFRISDSLAGNNPARIIGYETMTDANTGTNLFPTTAQFSGGLYIPKSTDTNPRIFWIAADSKTCYFAVAGSATNFRNVVPILCMGEFKSLGANDSFDQIVASSTTTTSAQDDARYSFLSSSNNRKFVSRSYAQTIGSKEVTNYFFYNSVLTFNAPGATNGFSYPNLPDNNLLLFDKVYIIESNSIRGYYRGITPTVNAIGPNQRNFDNDRIFENLPSAGKISLLKWIGHFDASATNDGAFFLDISGPWD